MGISAAKTFVLSRGDVVLPLVKEETPVAVPVVPVKKSSGLKADKIIVLSKKNEQKEETVTANKRNPLTEWKAEKPGKKSLFLQDILTSYE